jgi:hypothetical protein
MYMPGYSDNKMKYGIFADYFSANQAQELLMPTMFFVQSG